MVKKKEKFAVGGVNRRRQILQLETETQTNSGSNPLGGFLSEYMDSDDEDDLDERAAEDETNTAQTKTNNSMTSEVEDFLKEIDAISGSNDAIKVSTPSEPASSVGNSSSAEVLATESRPSTDVPQCSWQECHDEGSGYTYFWNMHTNEVTWECPEEYQRYVERLVAMKQSVPPTTHLAIPSSSLRSTLPSTSRVTSNIKSDCTNAGLANVTSVRKSRKPSIEEGKVVLITSYGWSSSNDENSSDEENEVKKDRVRSVVSTSHSPTTNDDSISVYYGPEPPPTSDGVLLYGPSLPPEHLKCRNAEADEVEVLTTPREVSSSNSLLDDNVSVKSESNSSSSNAWVLTDRAVVSQSTEGDVETQEEPDSTTVKPKTRSSPTRIVCSLARFDGATDKNDLTASRSSFCSSSVLFGVETKSNDVDCDRVKWDDNLQYNPDNSGNGRPCRPGFGFEGREKLSLVNTRKRTTLRKRAAVSFVKSETLDLNEVNHHNALEYKAYLAESQTCDKVSDSLDDIDVIERELDIALERKRAKYKDSENQEEESFKNETCDEDSTDKIASVKHPDSSESLVVGSVPMNETEDEISQNSIGNVSNVILEKLCHFGAKTSDLTDLQILVVEMKTRLKDWIEGVLNTDYFVGELQVYKNRIRQLESASVPEGWICEWDRSSKCYNYINSTTGQTRRKNPKDDDDDDTTRKLFEPENKFDTVTERLLDIPAFASFNPTSSSDSLPVPNKSEVSYSYSTTFLHPDSCLPPLPSVPLPCPPLPPPDTPPLPPPPPDSTEPYEMNSGATAPIPLPPEDREVSNTDPTVSAFPVYGNISSLDTYPTSSALESELDSFYSNIAADEANAATWSVPSVSIVTPLLEVPVPAVIDSRESDPPLVSNVPIVQRPLTSTKKKIKKTKIASGLILKKKNIPSLVEKWKRIKREQLEENEMSPTSSRMGGSS